MKFTKKTAHRLIIAAAMVAPALYLFGAMVAGLCGAHGEQIYAQESIVDITPTYEELMTPESFRYDAFDWDTEHGTRLGFSLGNYYLRDFDYSFFYFGSTGISLETDSNRNANCGLGYFGDDDQYISVVIESNDNDDWYVDEVVMPEGDYIVAFYGINRTSEQAIVCIFNSCENGLDYYRYLWGNGMWLDESTSLTGTWEFYFDDGSHLSSEAREEFNLQLSRRLDDFDNIFKPTVKTREVVTEDYTTGIFGNFFPKYNFVERIGRNAVGENPAGFTPYAYLLRYLDQNMFHAGESQIAYMVYGMVYWMLHVVLADLIYHCAVFIPNFFVNIFDRFNGGIKDE